MYLILKDLLTTNVADFIGATVTGITLRDYGVELHLMPAIHLHVVEYWELHDQNGATIDRAVTANKRQESFLFKLIGKKVVSTEKKMDCYFIQFDGGLQFVIHFDPRANRNEREEERKRVFGPTFKNGWDV